MVFRAGLRDSCTQDVARFLRLLLVYFYPFRKSSNMPSAWITQSCRENHSVIVLKNFSHNFFVLPKTRYKCCVLSETQTGIKPKSRCYVVRQRCFKQPKVANILTSFCIFVFLCKQITKKIRGFEVQWVCKKALWANKIYFFVCTFVC